MHKDLCPTRAILPTSLTHALFGILLLSGLVATPAKANDSDLEELESLGKVTAATPSRLDNEVTSVGKKSQRASETAAAIFVITPEDIRRSGVTSLPEALRLAPGVQVARAGSGRWAVTARGFNGVFANKLLVLIDGREVYSPSFGGVYWDVQDLPLDDIQRIEVIRGPGASLWGANAVNGVINVITQSAENTLGGRFKAGGGNQEQGYGSLRYGMQLGDNTYGRIYAKGANRGSFNLQQGGDAGDRWGSTRTGFRVDGSPTPGNRYLVEGAAYQNDYEQTTLLPTMLPPYNVGIRSTGRASGFHLLGRWRRSLSLSSEISLQAFYDHSYRNEIVGHQERDTLDLEMQHRFAWGERQEINWGLGYRLLKDRLATTTYTQFFPAAVNRQLFSAFLQDDISLIGHELTLTLGAKLQHNDYTGFEGQPSVRLMWTPNPRHSLWSAISRAVRTATRVECCASSDFAILPPGNPANPTGLPVMVGSEVGAKFRSERVWSYELGYRFKPTHAISFESALFYNRYNSLIVWKLPTTAKFDGDHVEANVESINAGAVDSYGAELNVEWRPQSWLAFQAAYSYLHFGTLSQPPNSFSVDLDTFPTHQAYLRASINPISSVDVDFWLRYVDRLKGGTTLYPVSNRIPAYLTLDGRIAWRPVQRLELALVGQNLLSPQHQEFVQEGLGAPPIVVPRAWYLQMSLDF